MAPSPNMTVLSSYQDRSLSTLKRRFCCRGRREKTLFKGKKNWLRELSRGSEGGDKKEERGGSQFGPPIHAFPP